MNREQILERRRWLLGDNWFNLIGDEFDKQYMQNISIKVAERRKVSMVYPAPDEIFKAWQVTPYEKVKVVIIGQDPYNDGTANGLAFAVNDYMYYPKSIEVINATVERQFHDGFRLNAIDPSLMEWAEQGIFLINSVLTVEHKRPNSHKDYGWQYFILRTIEELNKKEFVVYLLWGSEAQRFKKYVSPSHIVLEAEHPIAHKYADRPAWRDKECLIKTNEILTQKGLQPISW